MKTLCSWREWERVRDRRAAYMDGQFVRPFGEGGLELTKSCSDETGRIPGPKCQNCEGHVLTVGPVR